MLAITVALIGVGATGAIGDGTVDAASQCVRFVDARFDAVGIDARNLNGEWVVVKNVCAGRLSIGGWRIRDRDGHTYRFPAGTRIGAGRAIKVHTGKGARRTGHMYMGRARPLWNNQASERAYLVNFRGVRVSTWPRTTLPAAPLGTAPAPTAATAPTDGTEPWSVPFLSRPASGPIRQTGSCDGLVIENRTFQDLGADVEAIHLENCKQRDDPGE